MTKQLRHIWLAVCFLLYFSASLRAQAPSQDINLDSLFVLARERAYEQNRAEARTLCLQILAINPNHHDASILYARTLAWDNQFQEAAAVLEGVILQVPYHEDALSALTDVMFWSGNPAKALDYIDRLLLRQPLNTNHLFRRASILHAMEENLQASVVLRQVLEMDPSHIEARNLLETIEVDRIQNQVALHYRGNYFDETSPWHLVFAEYGRNTSGLGLVIARINLAERFNNRGVQFELDAYPAITRGTYLYLNAGYSPQPAPFPEFRAGLEIFQKLPRSWEVSAGTRLLDFPANRLVIITGSLNKYFRQYLVSFRPFWTIPEVGDPAQSYFATIRRYFKSPEHHLTLTLGTGFPADAAALSGSEWYDLESNMLMLNYQQVIATNYLLRTGLGLQIYPDGIWGNKYTLEAGIAYRF